jgi:Ca-activated chloride channel family protein
MNTDFRIEQPWYLLLLLLLPAVWFLRKKVHRPAALRFAPSWMFSRDLSPHPSPSSLIPPILFFSAASLLICALARPQLGVVSSRLRTSGIDIMILLDVSRSMLSEDFSIGSERASRIEVVKQVTENFIRNRVNDRIGIIAFAGRPYLVSPLTLDHDWLLENLSRLRIGLTEDGTAIGSALVSAANRLKDRSVKSRVIVLLTDGDNNAGKVPPETAAEAAAAIGIKIYTIGAGTNGLVPFPETDRFGNKFYTQQYMPFQEDACRQIASIGHGRFYRATDTRSLHSIFADIDQLEKKDFDLQEFQNYRDFFPALITIGLALLTSGTVLKETVWRKIP